ncbi:MAG: NDP-sugar synthase [Nitrospina sp.]|jgi:NDP-sugar pyrophosphorylase family protein|nr:NDP-sugar synthase [Nitrospina sp.]MBT4047478.1 NDP-sugar synthase [Nitrospina sp.]MBT5347943.1 NDP-sugar synthase [Nitrospina sp.]MBT5651659.1 NDP-sugar synthase [Nitrospina sp.]MBT6900379.1 NDP-sugar synthase [Nitrospina sp.]
MRAMILAAGFGTRLKPLTLSLPKPMFPVLNRPLLEHTLNLLSSQGIQDIIVNVHHLPEKIIDYFGNGSDFGVRLQFSQEEEILGTAGGLKKTQSFLEEETFLVINSDVLADIDLKNVLSFHKEKKSCLTLVVRKDSQPEKYKPIELANDGRITRFVDASIKNPPTTTQRVMFTGIQIMEPEIFSRIPSEKFFGTAEDVFPKMIEEGLPVFGTLHEKYWIDMGTRETYIQAQADALNGKLALKTSPSRNPEGPLVIPPVLIGKDCEISQDAQIGPHAVLGDGCRIRSGTVVENSILWDGATIGSDATVQNSIIGKEVVVENGAKVMDNSLSSTS